MAVGGWKSWHAFFVAFRIIAGLGPVPELVAVFVTLCVACVILCAVAKLIAKTTIVEGFALYFIGIREAENQNGNNS